MEKDVFKGIRKGKTAAERLKITDAYYRFDQKEHMIFAGEWNKEFEGITYATFAEGRAKMLKKNLSGYERRDWAFQMAATAGSSGARFSINDGDSGGNSWQPIKERIAGGEAISELPKWMGDASENTEMLKRIALRFGASDAGVCMLDRRFVYSHYWDKKDRCSYPIKFSDEEGYEDITVPGTLADKTRVIPKEMKYVLVLIYPMDLDGIRTAPRLTQMATTMETYSQIAFTSMSVAEFIRGLGYHAIPSANDTASNIPLAIDAGLGEATRASKLCHPIYGTCCRISKIITDMPLIPDEPIEFGVYEFCKSCGRCADKCPSKAIPHLADVSDNRMGTFSPEHVTQWQMDHGKCRKYCIKIGTNCGLCIASCPLNQADTPEHRERKTRMAEHPEQNKELMEEMLKAGGGSLKTPDDFWNEL